MYKETIIDKGIDEKGSFVIKRTEMRNKSCHCHPETCCHWNWNYHKIFHQRIDENGKSEYVDHPDDIDEQW